MALDVQPTAPRHPVAQWFIARRFMPMVLLAGEAGECVKLTTAAEAIGNGHMTVSSWIKSGWCRRTVSMVVHCNQPTRNENGYTVNANSPTAKASLYVCFGVDTVATVPRYGDDIERPSPTGSRAYRI